jgi:MFS family permease
VLLAITAVLFNSGTLTATTQTAAWCVIFFFASAGASSAYLTVSEVFPMETRAMAISFFYAVGTAIGGITGPLLFGRLIEAGGETNVMYGYLLGAALMIAAGVVEIVLGVEAAGRQLEDIAKPLTAEDAEAHDGGDGELDVGKLQGEDAAPIQERFDRDRETEKTGGEP